MYLGLPGFLNELGWLNCFFISAPPRDRTNYSTHKKADKAAGGDIAVNIGASILFLYSVSDRWATPPDHDILPVLGHSHRMRHQHQTSNTDRKIVAGVCSCSSIGFKLSTSASRIIFCILYSADD